MQHRTICCKSDLGNRENSNVPMASCWLNSGLDLHTTIVRANKQRSFCNSTTFKVNSDICLFRGLFPGSKTALFHRRPQVFVSFLNAFCDKSSEKFTSFTTLRTEVTFNFFGHHYFSYEIEVSSTLKHPPRVDRR